MTRKLLLILPLALAACGPMGPIETASLPRDAVIGAGDPTRAAVANVGAAFTTDGRMRGTAAQNARTIAQLEFLTVNTVNNPVLNNVPPTLPPTLMSARQEWRQALGIPAAAPAQQVVDQLYASARAAEMGGTAPLNLAVFQAPPALPRTAAAAGLAAQALRERSNPDRSVR